VSSLSISGLSAGYGQVRVIEDLSMEVRSGETVALLGTNGNGKSTLMRCVMGLLTPTAGSIKLEIDGTTHELAGTQTEDIVALGVVMVPEGRRLFPRLSVEETHHRRLPAPGAGCAAQHRVLLRGFPRLKERRASSPAA
jgi:branched-chain amino acid transport system ATP-binding protein